MKSNAISILLIMAVSLQIACNQQNQSSQEDDGEMMIASQEQVDKLVESFILAEEGSTIEIPAGHYELSTQLILDNINNVTIRGAGMEKSILSFKDLKTGGEGIKIVGNNILLEDFSVYDAPGDGIKTQHCDGITFRRVNATWTNGDKSQNGTYAIYPVQCSNVMIDECSASHSRDAGIYVGQSDNIIVKNCTAFGNVAGIEIENCTNAEVFDNKAYDNASGILVFNLPGLPKADGSNTRVYNNEITENNHINFATAIGEGPNGNTVTLIPPGTGIILLAAKDVEIFNNKILRNKTVGIAIANYQITGFPVDAQNWSPFTSNISIHDNEFDRGTEPADITKPLGQLIAGKNAYGEGITQDILYDGFWDPGTGMDITANPMNICIDEEEIESLHFTRFYLMEGMENVKAFSDYEPFVCQYSVSTDLKELNNK